MSTSYLEREKKTQILKTWLVMLVVLLGAASVANAELISFRELVTQGLGQISSPLLDIPRDIQFAIAVIVIPIFSLIFVLFLRIATRWAVDFEISYWTARKIMIIFSAISYVIPILLAILLAALTGIPAGLLLLYIVLLFCIIDFFAGPAICGMVIKDPETSSPVGFVTGMLVFFYLMLIGFVLGITIALLLIIAMLMGLPLAIVSLFLIAALYLGFGAYVLPIAIKKASDWWAFLCGAQFLIGTFATIFWCYMDVILTVSEYG